MATIDRALICLLIMGVWALVASQLVSNSHAQDPVSDETDTQPQIVSIHATDIVGLSAFVQQTVRDHQFRPQSMPGLDQHVRSIVRNCRISGSVSGGRLSGTHISC